MFTPRLKDSGPLFSPFPGPFPEDLEREILETTAKIFPSFVPTLLRVAQRAKHWLEPFLYTKLCVDGKHGSFGDKIARKIIRLLDTDQKHLFSQTQSLCLTYHLDRSTGKQVLSAAIQWPLSRLCIWMPNKRGESDLSALITRISMSELAIEVTFFYSLVEYAHLKGCASWLQGLTHVQLMLWDYSSTPIPSNWGAISNPFTLLSSLTHISIAEDGPNPSVLIRDYLLDHETLHTIVVIGAFDDHGDLMPLSDPIPPDSKGKRIVGIPSPSLSTRSWSNDGLSIWEEAEIVIARKMQDVGSR